MPLMEGGDRKVPAEPQVGVTQIPLDLSADYLSGCSQGLADQCPWQKARSALRYFQAFPDFDGLAVRQRSGQEKWRPGNLEDTEGDEQF